MGLVVSRENIMQSACCLHGSLYDLSWLRHSHFNIGVLLLIRGTTTDFS
jgi:hypothetical protein